MPRAHRNFLPSHVWHITHRCHRQEFLLKFARDRDRYLQWLFEAKKRFGLCVFNYMVTSNHIHLLVRDTGQGEIAQSMQLVAGRTAQEYNQRKNRKGAFWEDRYHATAIESDAHLHRCLVYIDMNMVRAGAVEHPAEWPHTGYREIQKPPERYAVINLAELSMSCGFSDVSRFQMAYREWVDDALTRKVQPRDDRWSQAIAVGSLAFVDRVTADLGIKARHRSTTEAEGTYALREQEGTYTGVFSPKNHLLRLDNTLPWQENAEVSET